MGLVSPSQEILSTLGGMWDSFFGVVGLGVGLASFLWVKGVCFYWRDHNLTPYNHSKNRSAWCDVEYYKRFKYVFLITNWF